MGGSEGGERGEWGEVISGRSVVRVGVEGDGECRGGEEEREGGMGGGD